MTTRNILIACRDHISDLITDYNVKFFGWEGKDFETSAPFIMFRFPGGGGPSNVLKQEIDVLVVLVQVPKATDPSARLKGHDDMANILRRYRQGGSTGSVFRFEPLEATYQGPMKMENDYQAWTLNIRCYTEDY